jgi:hypothetical protein
MLGITSDLPRGGGDQCKRVVSYRDSGQELSEHLESHHARTWKGFHPFPSWMSVNAMSISNRNNGGRTVTEVCSPKLYSSNLKVRTRWWE